MKNIVLIGFMGSGKTTVGTHLARYTKSYLIDTDMLIAAQNSQSIKNIFENYGEEYFRKLEADFIQWVEKNIQNAIIATGGGMPIFNPVRGMGKVFYLKIDFEKIQKRLTQTELDSRPLLKNISEAYEIYKNRQTLYAKSADIIINADQPIDKVVSEILKYIP
ncbi:hypothetical protein BKH41_00415 [Helicobacter sp. 12S02232-10]|uniref:shikimate kinase n=1 Tax=Helicobacter sp. 12S02232-10 TaxID=1476197 RepID=UPI000BA79A15|nr:shikimate kinase [Helicobacter sp. 12S02232-10]PAF49803.1 hypothetical protein BKH41_00415 [Helicobacter sp. 12S02232-10]